MRVQMEPRRTPRKREEAVPGEPERVERRVGRDDLKAEMDELLDEIDSVLEENAEEFVRAYVQKGGE